MKRIICCRCEHKGQLFTCRKCGHKICTSCREPFRRSKLFSDVTHVNKNTFGRIGRRYPGPKYKKVGSGIGRVD